MCVKRTRHWFDNLTRELVDWVNSVRSFLYYNIITHHSHAYAHTRYNGDKSLRTKHGVFFLGRPTARVPSKPLIKWFTSNTPSYVSVGDDVCHDCTYLIVHECVSVVITNQMICNCGGNIVSAVDKFLWVSNPHHLKSKWVSQWSYVSMWYTYKWMTIDVNDYIL